MRSKGGYGKAAEEAMAAKRADYFQAGTRIVWDVDPRSKCIHVYSRTIPTTREPSAKGSRRMPSRSSRVAIRRGRHLSLILVQEVAPRIDFQNGSCSPERTCLMSATRRESPP